MPCRPLREAVFCLSLLFSARPSWAFTIQNAVSDGCHERVTWMSLRALRNELSTAGPLPLSGEDKAMIDDAAFDIPPDMRDLGGAALLFGVREPDLHGSSGDEIDHLAEVHGDPSSQHEHCLRREGDDDPDGPKLALAACREHILQQFTQALDGLDASGAPDPSHRVPIEISLAFRGKVTVQLPLFHLRMGASIHAMQDAFTHSLRTDDGLRVTTVLNWIDWVNHRLDESRDGPAHLLPMDRCQGHPLLDQRRTLAVQATSELLRAALDPSLDRAHKIDLATTTVDQYLGYQPGCSADNRWCDAKELDVNDPKSCLCQAPGRPARGASAPAAAAALALLGAAWRRRRGTNLKVGASLRHSGPKAAESPPHGGAADAAQAASAAQAAPRQRSFRRRSRRAAGWHRPSGWCLLALLLASSPALAADEALPPVPPKAPEPKPQSGFALYLAGGGSVDRPGAAAILGGRYRLGSAWLVGADAEWNPWFNKVTTSFRPGVFNGYATLIRQFPLKYEAVNLRTTINLGTSVLLMDLVGAPKGHPGIFGGLSMLGIEWRVHPGTYVVIDPIHIILPFPQITGVPFGYTQYRFTLGIEFG